MQELFLNAYLAYRSDRAYASDATRATLSERSILSRRFVFDNYTWSRDEGDYSLYNLKPIPSRIPLTALIRGVRSPLLRLGYATYPRNRPYRRGRIS